MVLSWLCLRVISYVMSRTRAGDVRPTLLLDAPDVQLTFPGQSSFSGVFRGKDAVGAWLRRFAAIGLQIYPDQMVAVGMPWNTTLCLRGHIFLESDAGEMTYENRYVIWGRMSWGRLKEYEVYEDTTKANALDAWLSEHRPALAGAAI